MKRRNTRGYKREQEWHIFNRLDPGSTGGAGDAFQFFTDQWVIGEDDYSNIVNVLKIDESFNLHSGVPFKIGALLHEADTGMVNVMNIPIVDATTDSLHGYRTNIASLPIVQHVGVADGLGGVSRRYSQFDGDLFLNNEDVIQPFTALHNSSSSNYGILKPLSTSNGGLGIYGLSQGDNASLGLYGLLGASDPTDTTAAINLFAGKSSTDTWTLLGDLETVFKLTNYTTDLITVLGNGYTGFGKIPEYNLDVVGSGYFSDNVYVLDYLFGGTLVTSSLKLAATSNTGSSGANIEFMYGASGASRAAYFDYEGQFTLDYLPEKLDGVYRFLVADNNVGVEGQVKYRSPGDVLLDLLGGTQNYVPIFDDTLGLIDSIIHQVTNVAPTNSEIIIAGDFKLDGVFTWGDVEYTAPEENNNSGSKLTNDGEGNLSWEEIDDIRNLLGSAAYADASQFMEAAKFNYIHTQASASTTWNIGHGLDRVVAVMVYDVAGREIAAEINMTDPDLIVLTFNQATAGVAKII